jgi:hypothetical protein
MLMERLMTDCWSIRWGLMPLFALKIELILLRFPAFFFSLAAQNQSTSFFSFFFFFFFKKKKEKKKTPRVQT